MQPGGAVNLTQRAWLPSKRFVRKSTGGNMALSPDFKEFIELLNFNKVRYLIVGGYAVAFHGYPRYTKDLDIWIENTAENAQRLMEALEQFGFGSLGLSEQDFLIPEQIIQLGYPPNRIDLITSLPGVSFHECYEARIEVEVDGVIARFIDLEHLKQNKRASGRFQDLADLENLAGGDQPQR
ncbi:MAG: hypothetical protein KatS3mg045_0050 [Bellilinea sp.]|nr:MAG: hypothetical protein KatS3mg045_0050 [Bellilinea sp.]